MPVEIEYLGHSGVLISHEKFTVAIDPYLTDNPVAKKKSADIRCTHLVLSHGHFDHASDAPQIIRNNDATFYAAFEIASWLESQGLKNSEGMNPGGKVKTPFGYIALTPAIHSSSFDGRYMANPCGIIVNIGGVTIYHTGDTALFGDMKLIGEIYRPDIAFVCAGDRYTMGPELAAKAAEFVGAKFAVPIHWGTWPPLAQEADLKAFNPAGVQVKLMRPGDTWRYEG